MRRALPGGWVVVCFLLLASSAGAQEVYSNSVRYSRGQSVQPVFEGWSRNPDGTFAMWFGYLNRNHEERVTVVAGPDNGFNGEDMGQPEFFETRRQQFAFKIDVPANFPKDRDLVWILKANGVTLKAFGCLWPVWEIDQHTISANRGSRTAVDFDEPPNEPPKFVDAPRSQIAEVGKPLTLSVSVADDGNPKPRTDRGARVAGIKMAGTAAAERPLNQSLRVSWLQWRGPGLVKFEPRVARVTDGRASATAVFDKPGTYVLRGYAEDASMHTPHDITVTVAASPAPPQR